MNPLPQFLSELRSLGVLLSVEDGRLVCNAPKGALTVEARSELAARKQEILQFLAPANQEAAPGGDPDAELPLSSAQQRLWIFAQINVDDPAYNMPALLRLTGQLDQSALQRALSYLVRRHEALRASFHARHGAPYGRIASDPAFSLQVMDLRQESLSNEREVILTEARKPFHLEQAPLFRANLFLFHEKRSLLLLVAHHIVADGWSLGILARELGQSYAAFAGGHMPQLTPLVMQYRDFIDWEKRDGERLAKEQLPYWMERLQGPLPVIDLPTDRRRPQQQTFHGRRLALHLGRSTGEKVRELARQSGTTAFIVMLSCFKVLLRRYAGSDDILVGSATSNRHKQEFTPIVGFFVNTLVLRTDLSGNPTFMELLDRLRDTAHGAYAHQDVSFNKLLETLHPERSASQSPLVQVLFTMQNVPFAAITLPGLEVSSEPFDAGTSRLDLSVEVWPENGGFRCDFEYNDDLFDETTIIALQRHFGHLLESFLDDPSTPIGNISLMDEPERELLLSQWNRSAQETAKSPSVAAWFKLQAQLTPEHIALTMGQTDLTYKQLDSVSDRLASALVSRGVTANRIVGLYLRRGPALVIAVLAVLKGGGSYLPLDPALPPLRLSYILEDSEVTTVLTEASIREQLPLSDDRVLLYEEAVERAVSKFVSPASADDLVYLIYTSGSTGNPKGTEITGRALLNLLASMIDTPGLSERDTFVAVSSITFDIATLEVLGPLLCGARLVLASAEETLDPVALASLLDRAGATVMQATPATWRMLLDSGWLGRAELRMWSGGEALSPTLAEALLARGRELWNLYGPTETTIWSTRHRVRSGEDPIPIGRPISNTRVYVLDEQRQLVPPGVPGELYIAGAGLARGYWNRPDLTEQRFVADPFFQNGERMYRTGDIARLQKGGTIQLLGRADQQIKLRGYRIELGEIEAVLGRHPDVLQAVVLLAGEGSAERLAAFLLEQPVNAINLDELRVWLRESLPEYMVPSSFIPLQSFPVTTSGKIDRKKLLIEQPAMRCGERVTDLLQPRSEMEARVAEVWSAVLGVEAIDIRDNFFEIGGNSLLLVRVHAQLRGSLGVEFSVVDLFRHNTVEGLAAYLSQQQRVRLSSGVRA